VIVVLVEAKPPGPVHLTVIGKAPFGTAVKLAEPPGVMYAKGGLTEQDGGAATLT
jgi:hypothetical protein